MSVAHQVIFANEPHFFKAAGRANNIIQVGLEEPVKFRQKSKVQQQMRDRQGYYHVQQMPTSKL
jgi:uncharacterized protein (UPF0261 family)